MMMIIIIMIMTIIDGLGRRVLRSPRDSGGWDFTFQSSKQGKITSPVLRSWQSSNPAVLTSLIGLEGMVRIERSVFDWMMFDWMMFDWKPKVQQGLIG